MNLPIGSSAAAPPNAELSGVWRVAIFLGVAAIAIVVLQLGMFVLFREGFIGTPLPFVWSGITQVVGLLLAHAVVMHRYHGGMWAFVGLQRAALAPSTLLRAAILGAVTIGVPSVLLLASGEMRIDARFPLGVSIWSYALSLLAVLVPAALWEELALRGYLFSVLCERFGTRSALLATSTLFGVLHLQNPGASVLSIAAVGLAGIFLGLIRLSTGSLYAAWAAHLAWNLTMSLGLRTPVSGIVMPMGGYRVVSAGPVWLTGGSWGPEGGVAAMLGMGVASWYIVRRMRREESTT